jgi:hypothetical protein
MELCPLSAVKYRVNVKVRVCIFLILVGASFVAAQSPSVEPESNKRYPDTSGRTEETIKRTIVRGSVWVSEYEPNSLEKKLLAPSREDEESFTQFLRLPQTGVIKMYPPGRRRVISIADLASGRRPGFGSYASLYSFSKEKHGNGLHGYVDPRLGWAELRLLNGRFITGFTGESLGVLVALGDVPLESVTPDTYGVTGLTNILPPTDYLEAASLSRRNRAGFVLEKFKYGSSLPVAENMTYVMRSTSNKRADVLVGLRVIRIDENGSVTLLWRKLKTYPKPQWNRATKEAP